ncbi:MAG: DUF465 domain-containing protein [Acidobacteriota bacterium]|nr:DUF465 domain-containing protein [Acidobacteriota bacterium]MDE3168790.1 DUF465 domain-containing protein [Acidobacteriota bacterium]
MPMEDIRQSLFATDSEFRRLAEEHSRCESQLEQIVKSAYLNAEDLQREAMLKKVKLRLKDRMESIVARYREMASQ